MKAAGLVIVMLAFLGGAFISSLDPATVDWNWMVPVLIAGAVGLWMHRKARHEESRADHKLAGNMDTLQRCLDRILGNLEDLDARKAEIHVAIRYHGPTQRRDKHGAGRNGLSPSRQRCQPRSLLPLRA